MVASMRLAAASPTPRCPTSSGLAVAKDAEDRHHDAARRGLGPVAAPASLQREPLALMPDGRSDAAIAAGGSSALSISQATADDRVVDVQVGSGGASVLDAGGDG
jgi:hypothetical protein